MSVRKLGFATLSALALLMSFHVPFASADESYRRDTDHHSDRDRHDNWGWYDQWGHYHRYDRDSRS